MVDRYQQLQLDIEIEDSAADDAAVALVKYDISSYGIDFDVEGLYRRLKRAEIFVPSFQRSYVWSLEEASRFIESLLLGLPVPGIFLARDEVSGKLLVIDGQQRLKSLMFFLDGDFNSDNSGKARQFKLKDVQGEFAGKTYATLPEKNRIDLDNAIIHATVVKQDHPQGDDTSIYHISERLNSGGRQLYPQEMRSALYHGTLIDTIQDLNRHESWRSIYGQSSARLRDQELILRFLGLYYSEARYSRPLKEFLTKFLIRHRNPAPEVLDSYSNTFCRVADLWWEALGNKAFRPSQNFNAAVFDSMFVALARRVNQADVPAPEKLARAYREVWDDADYRSAIVTRSTSEESSVQTRLDKATSRIAEL